MQYVPYFSILCLARCGIWYHSSLSVTDSWLSLPSLSACVVLFSLWSLQANGFVCLFVFNSVSFLLGQWLGITLRGKKEVQNWQCMEGRGILVKTKMRRRGKAGLRITILVADRLSAVPGHNPYVLKMKKWQWDQWTCTIWCKSLIPQALQFLGLPPTSLIQSL